MLTTLCTEPHAEGAERVRSREESDYTAIATRYQTSSRTVNKDELVQIFKSAQRNSPFFQWSWCRLREKDNLHKDPNKYSSSFLMHYLREAGELPEHLALSVRSSSILQPQADVQPSAWPDKPAKQDTDPSDYTEPAPTYDFSSCFPPKFKKSTKRGFSREKTYFFGFYGPRIGGGVLLPESCPKISKTLKFGLFWGIFASSGLVLQNSAAHQCTCL